MKANILVESVFVFDDFAFFRDKLTKSLLITIIYKYPFLRLHGGKIMIVISPAEMHGFLKAKGVEYLYFSTTVKNACSMIHSDSLLSLRLLSFNQLPMTPVDNISAYKETNMWNKVPLYLCNLHGYFTRQNKNGPVSLKISVDFLSEIHERDLCVSKRNPLNWKNNLTKNDICYSSVEEFSKDYDTLLDSRRIHKTLFLIRDKKSQIKLSKYLCEISLDYLHDRHLLYKKSENTLKEAIKQSELNNVPFITFKCNNFCFCQTNYNEMTKKELESLFLP